KMKVAIVRKHLDKVEAPQPLRLVPSSSDPVASLTSPIVREVQGRGHFQIRKVTKADLRKAAEALSQQEERDPFELYRAEPAAPVAPV
ncbi:hypothetical protein OVW21_26775, partial [Klebsiella pneumoniae]|uniref:hypothetical protein n=1 Tax=Klebsiella pneumoniae TaxID=573 RepID=UPI0022707AF6